MVISASRRTDVPAFHAEWLVERLRAGTVDVPNPFDPKRVRRVSLAPADVDCLVLWTKDPRPLMERLDALEAFPFYFQFSLNAYGRDVEPGVPPLDARVDAFLRLADRIGPERVVWRCDPVLLSPAHPPAFHEEAFAALAARLDGATDTCVLSFVDEYPRVRRAMRALGLRAPDPEEARALAASFAAAARPHGLALSACAEPLDLAPLGIPPARCVDPVRIRRISGRAVPDGKDKAQRPACGCAPSVDIGTYGTCGHGCVYCYAQRAARPGGAVGPMEPASR